ncbi:hypothetical protein [Thermostaphylospora chromogena]|uniref:DUF4352 domain-containing protein n=1 Tax=Thermostaphylospora chromogena TaxID=35622 RepID=A0A1H1GKH0_9ACTN|nr:hypothetical protein [Thermostaphylospora chromogena]SDR13378.1 hypothetical protein SAMN04489764_3636 [Thermostaphylospora chromogena]
MRTRIAAVTGAAALALALTGCGGIEGIVAGGGEERQPTPAQEQTDDDAGPSGTPRAAAGTAQAPSPEPADRNADPVAVKKFSDGAWQVSIDQLDREGKVVTLNFSITNLNDREWQVSSDLGHQIGDWSVGGVSLIDPVNAKRHRPGRTGDTDVTKDGTCLCSTTHSVFIRPGETHSFYAVFAAPPPEVTAVHVEIPRMGTFTNVPLT